ncbi:serine/threonine-protein kinase [Nocardia blacklockiae]|uniref:serine/threonine-protein kinase n=1 Tax=Nocardia blacklockiae TaxID=480036 RepID=UPI001896097D|nr:serine/threonine-protein kinase [Nocardia blacklockiae]MBF6172466.1 protein kinase [Nocardia blacklockiae]
MAARRFGKYRLDRLIGRGSVGEVWLARDTVADRSVALKILTITAGEDPDYRRRFEREARVGAGLSNPHIVPIHDFGEQDGRLFLDMAHVPGTDLARRLRPGPIAAAEAVDIVSQIAEALDAAHTAGLIHRDVKPANVIVHPSGFAYLIDFGIARSPNQTTITATGFTIGTLAYMAPERFTGHADVRSDVYALACVLFECLTAQRPFGDTNPVQQLHAHLRSDPPRPSADNPDVPPALDAVIARGMAKEPADRYPTAGALATAARTALGLPHPTPRTPPLPEQTPTESSTQAIHPPPGTPLWAPQRKDPSAHPQTSETPAAQSNSQHPPTRSLPEDFAAQVGATQPPPKDTAAQPHTPVQPTHMLPSEPVDAAGQPLRPTRVMPDDPHDAAREPLSPTRVAPEGPIDAAGQPLRPTRVMPEDPHAAAGQPLRPTGLVPDGPVDAAGRPLRPTRVMPGGADAAGRPLQGTRVMPGAGGGQPPWQGAGSYAGGGTGPQPNRPEQRQGRSVVKIASVVVGVAILGFALVAACTAALTQSGGGQPSRQPAVSATPTAETAPNTVPQTGKDWPPPGFTLQLPTGFPTTFQLPIPTLQFPTQQPNGHKPNKEDKKPEH